VLGALSMKQGARAGGIALGAGDALLRALCVEQGARNGGLSRL